MGWQVPTSAFCQLCAVFAWQPGVSPGTLRGPDLHTGGAGHQVAGRAVPSDARASGRMGPPTSHCLPGLSCTLHVALCLEWCSPPAGKHIRTSSKRRRHDAACWSAGDAGHGPSHGLQGRRLLEPGVPAVHGRPPPGAIRRAASQAHWQPLPVGVSVCCGWSQPLFYASWCPSPCCYRMRNPKGTALTYTHAPFPPPPPACNISIEY